LPSYNRYGIDFHLNPRQGLIFINEFVFDFLIRGPAGLEVNGPGRWFIGPGRLVIGGLYSTDRMEDIYQAQLRTLGVIPASKGIREFANDYGTYLILEEKIYEPAPGSACGLFLFGRYFLLPSDRNFDQLSAEIGFVYKGIFQRQVDLRDSFGVCLAYNRISDRVRQADNFAGSQGIRDVPNFQFESAVETTYAYPIKANWQLQPDLQWVIRPGAAGRYGNAVVLGMRSVITF
jgi:porin